jgi:hypothetical protein
MKKLLVILTIVFIGCNNHTTVEQSNTPKVTPEYPKAFTFSNYNAYKINLGSDGHEYIENKRDYALVHSPECVLCKHRVDSARYLTAPSRVDTVFIPKKDSIVQKRIRLLCVSADKILQNGKMHGSTSNLDEGTVYTTIAKPYVSPETGDSVYYIDGVGERLTHRFVKPL